jgi:hypothetical protein
VSSIAQPHFTQNYQEPTRCCDVCELDVPSLTSWYGVSLCADCLDLQATRTAHGDSPLPKRGAGSKAILMPWRWSKPSCAGRTRRVLTNPL